MRAWAQESRSAANRSCLSRCRTPSPIDECVVGDAVKPVLERRRAAIRRNPPRRPDKSLLSNVVGLGFSEAHAVGESVNHLVVAVEKDLERSGIARLSTAHQLCFGHILALDPHSIFVGKDGTRCKILGAFGHIPRLAFPFLQMPWAGAPSPGRDRYRPTGAPKNRDECVPGSAHHH
jgi:hypothetical protein